MSVKEVLTYIGYLHQKFCAFSTSLMLFLTMFLVIKGIFDDGLALEYYLDEKHPSFDDQAVLGGRCLLALKF